MHQSKPTTKTRSTDQVFISSTFEMITSRPIDSKRRVYLGQQVFEKLSANGPFESFNILVDGSGYVLLIPMAHIPASERWTWTTPAVRESLDRAAIDAKEGNIEEAEDLDAFLESI